MARRLRIFAYLALLVALLVGSAGAQPDEVAGGNGTPTSVRVKVERVDGGEFEGTIADPVLKIETAFGKAEVDLNLVKAVDFLVDDAHTDVVVELIEGEHLEGRVAKDATIRVTKADGSIETLTLTGVREIKVLRAPDLSLVAIVSGLVMLTLLEIILGVDNVILLTILVGKLPKEQQRKARLFGLGAALATRLLLLFTLTWMLGLTKSVITLPIPSLGPDARELSWRDIILLAGGLFLIVKSVNEMREKLHEASHAAAGHTPVKAATSFIKTIIWIAIIDIVFSLDSVITAVGTVDASLLWVMVTAVVISMGVMLLFAKPIGDFVDGRPTVKILALAFLILIGVLLVAEGFGQHVRKGYVYFAMAFAVLVEFVNLRLRPTKKGAAET